MLLEYHAAMISEGFLGHSDGKASGCNAGNLGPILGLGRPLGEGNSNPFQYSCLENPMNRGAWLFSSLLGLYVCVCMCVCAWMLMYVLIWENIHALSFIDLNLWENIILVENPERPMDISSALVSWQHTRTHY